MSTYHERKAARKKQFLEHFKVKMIICHACSGSGYYDANGSPPCGCCDGKGKVLPSLPKEKK